MSEDFILVKTENDKDIFAKSLDDKNMRLKCTEKLEKLLLQLYKFWRRQGRGEGRIFSFEIFCRGFNIHMFNQHMTRFDLFCVAQADQGAESCRPKGRDHQSPAVLDF